MRTAIVLVLFLACVAPLRAEMGLLGVLSQGTGVGTGAGAGPQPALDPAVAGQALDAWLAEYYYAGERNFRKSIPGPHQTGGNVPGLLKPIAHGFHKVWHFGASHVGATSDGLGQADFWWVPHMWQTVMDGWKVTGDAKYRKLIDDIYDGFLGHYSVAENAFNDDLVWLALACVQAYEQTKEQRFLDQAKALHASIARYESQTFGGGITWKRDGSTFKNTPINNPFVILSCRLYAIGGDAAYLATAQRIQAWVVERFWHDGLVDDGVDNDGPHTAYYTYNFGTFIGASLALYHATGDRAHLDRARRTWARAREQFAASGIVKSEGTGDGGGFKMILCRYLVELQAEDHSTEIADFLARNAQSAWDRRRTADDVMGTDWNAATESGVLESFAACSGVAVQQFARMTR